MRYGLPASGHQFNSFEEKSTEPLHGFLGLCEAVKAGEQTPEAA
jgi:hypothetical protein